MGNKVTWIEKMSHTNLNSLTVKIIMTIAITTTMVIEWTIKSEC